MKNHNISEISGNVEQKIKNGDFRVFITFNGNNSTINKLNFDNIKELESDSDLYNIERIITKSPFRIGKIMIDIINCNQVLKKDKAWTFDTVEFEKIINLIIRKYKNTIIALPICGNLLNFKNDIVKVLEDNVRDTKVVILEK
jgi:hypothetical protein